jgi:hypothetical protein
MTTIVLFFTRYAIVLLLVVLLVLVLYIWIRQRSDK